MIRLEKQQLADLRKAAGYGYAPAVEAILKNEFSYSVTDTTRREIYDVANGKNVSNQPILEAFLRHVIRKTKATSNIQDLAGEALKLINSTSATA